MNLTNANLNMPYFYSKLANFNLNHGYFKLHLKHFNLNLTTFIFCLTYFDLKQKGVVLGLRYADKCLVTKLGTFEAAALRIARLWPIMCCLLKDLTNDPSFFAPMNY